MTRNRLAGSIAAILLLATSVASAPAAAQGNYPSRPVKIVLPVPPATALDVVTRVIAEEMSKTLGQRVLIESRPGGGGLLAAQAVARAPADGYTLLGGAAGIFTILPGQKDNLPIDLERSFTHVGMIVGHGVMFLAVPPKLGIKTFPEFVALAKAQPGKLVIGTNGVGTLPHYAGLLLQRKGGLPVTIAPYARGGTPAVVTDIKNGLVHATIEASFGLRGHMRSGTVQVIGAMSAARDPEFPSVPTIAETMPGLTAVGFMSLAAPAKIPESVARRLNDSLNQTLKLPAIKQRFAELGVPIAIVSPAQANAFVNEQRKIWLPLVRELEGR
ncbi:MAG: Bug family tripartite tricarboxylate transporter substrate binding protein [Beijerinckiaceae bacterium]